MTYIPDCRCVLVSLLADVLDGFALLLKAGVGRENVGRVQLQRQRVFPNVAKLVSVT